jgi:hypothetical protein
MQTTGCLRSIRFASALACIVCTSCTPADEMETTVTEAAPLWGWGDPPQLELIGRFQAEGEVDSAAATIVAFDWIHDRLFVTNVGLQRIDVVDLDDPSAPAAVGSIDVTPWGRHANSVAVSIWGVVAAAIEADDPQAPGTLAFFDGDGDFIASVTVGALPDMVTFTPDGKYALVANEGEPNDDYTIDPDGSISVVDLRFGVHNLTQSRVHTADFHAFDGAPLDSSIRITGPGATASADFEPEHIAVSHDSRTAWVTLQENNALAIVDVRDAEVDDVVGLGLKDHLLPGRGLDPSDKDLQATIGSWPVLGIPQPDGVAYFERGHDGYLVMANEGDKREYDGFDEVARVSSRTLDPTAFPNAAALKQQAAMGRLEVTVVDGDPDQDGDYDSVHAFGARSFSIHDEDGALVFDSGDALEQITRAASPAGFNANNDGNASFDTRSDNSGPEPEGVVVGQHLLRNYAFIGLERIGGIVVYDVTKPWAPELVQYINTRDFAGDPEAGTAGDLGPEGLLFVPWWKSPTLEALLIVAHEISGTTAIYRFQ